MNKIAFCPRMSKTVRRSLYETVGIISMQPRTIAWFTQELLELKMKSTTYDPTSIGCFTEIQTKVTRTQKATKNFTACTLCDIQRKCFTVNQKKPNCPLL